MFSCEYCESFKNSLFYKTPRWLLLKNKAALQIRSSDSLKLFLSTEKLGRKFFAINVSQNLMKTFKNLLQTQPAITCSKLTIETLERGVKYLKQ